MADLKNVVWFVVTADEDVDQNFVTVTFSASETGADANKVQAALAVRLKDALDIARPNQVPDQVEVKSGVFQINPTYDKKSAINGYQGYVNMIVSGTDTDTITRLTGEIKSMNVAGVQQSVSPSRRKEVEQILSLKVIKMWREKAAAYTEAFEAPSFSLVNANISVSDAYRPYARSMAALESVGDGQISVEPGKETLTASINGTIQLSC